MSQFEKYAAVAALAFRQRLAERAALYGRMMFYFVVLLTFSRLWQAVLGTPAGADSHDPNALDYVWYLTVTEWIVLSQPLIWQDIEADVRSGAVAYQLSRPMSYAGARLAEAAGELALRWVVLGACGLAFGRLFSGGWPSAMGLALAVPVAALASAVLLLMHLGIGLSAFWLHDCTSVYLIWQKLMFVLGGLMVPLAIYPAWVREIANYTPFAALLSGPARLVMEVDPALAVRSAAELVGWGALAALGVVGLARRGRRAITLHGG